MAIKFDEYEIKLTQKLLRDMGDLKNQLLTKAIRGYSLIILLKDEDVPISQAVSYYDAIEPVALLGSLEVTKNDMLQMLSNSPAVSRELVPSTPPEDDSRPVH